MSKTIETAPTIADQLAEARHRLAELESEQGEFAERFSALVADGAVDALAGLQSRQSVLPFMIRGQRAKVLQLEIHELESQIDPAEAANSQAWAIVQTKQDAFNRAREELREAQGAHYRTDQHRQWLRERVAAKHKELAQLQAEPTAPRRLTPRPPGPAFG
jgi:hypothetical protein